MRNFVMLGGAAALALVPGGGNAQDAAPEWFISAESLTVLGTRTERPTDEIPASITVIDAEEIERLLATDIKDLIRFEPGVSVRTQPARFTAAGSSTGRDGNSGFNIRGLEGNRVLILVDGIRLPDAFSFGPAAFGRGDYLDLDILQTVEILRGPASALYGSDGLAGAVSFITRDPKGFLTGEEWFAGRTRLAYSSADSSLATSLTGAVAVDAWSALIAWTHREGAETDNQGDIDTLDLTRTTPNPQEIVSDSLLVKLVFEPDAASRFRLALDYGERDIETEVFTGRAVPPFGATSVLDLDARDTSERTRGTLDYLYQGEGLIDRVFAAAYVQTSEIVEFSAEDRNTAADRTRETVFTNDVWGVTLQFDSVFEWLVPQRLVYGLEYSETRQEGVRDGTVPPPGESFPSRPFPSTDYSLLGLFIQDEIALLDGRLDLIPALRYDAYELTPEADALYTQPVAGQSDDYLSPKFGVVFWPVERFGLYANYAAGFKAPAPSQVNNGFTNIVFNYVSIPNPLLRPETSEAVEFGLRTRDLDVFGATLSGSVAVFTATYEDFIEQVQIAGTFTPGDPGVFQFVNLGEVEISGAELRADAIWASGWSLRLAAAVLEGNDVSGPAELPLKSVDPWRVVLGLGYDDPGERFGGQVILTHSAAKERDDVSEVCGAPCFLSPEFTTLDLTGYLNVAEGLTLRFGVFNLTDEKYWWWSDVRGVSQTANVLDAYTAPGRNVSAAIAVRF